MARKAIIMTVDPIGVTTIEAEGYEGGTCIEATMQFETLLNKTERERVAVGECGPRRDDGERVNI